MKIWQNIRRCRGALLPHEAMLVALVTVPFVIVFLSAVGFVLRIPIQAWYFPSAFCAGCVSLIWFSRESRLCGVMLLTCVFAGGILFSSLQVILPPGDGQYCHYPAISLLSKGWNPWLQTEWEDVARLSQNCAYWHIAYTPHAGWICGAALAKLFGYVSVADSWSYWAAVLGILSLLKFVSQFEFLSRWMKWSIAFCMFFTPTIGWYWFTGTFDIAWYGLLLSAVVGVDLYVRTKSVRLLPVVLMATVLMCGIKATGVVASVVLFGVYGFYSLVCLRSVKVFAVGLLALVLIPLVNPAPYVTNSINHCSPFYPAHSFDKNEKLLGDKLTWDFSQMNDDAKELGYWGRMCYAWISQDAVKAIHRKLSGNPKFEPKTMVDVGGYGVLFRFFVVAALLLWPFVRNRSVNLAATMLVVTVMIQPTYFSGYARYVNQVYLFPWIIFLGFVNRYWHQIPKLVYCGGLLWTMPFVLLYRPLHRVPTFWLMNYQTYHLVQDLRDADSERLYVATESAYHRNLFNDEWRVSFKEISTQGEVPCGFTEAGVCGQWFSVWTDVSIDSSCCNRALIPMWDFEKKDRCPLNKELYRRAFVGFYKDRIKDFAKTCFSIFCFRIRQVVGVGWYIK